MRPSLVTSFSLFRLPSPKFWTAGSTALRRASDDWSKLSARNGSIWYSWRKCANLSPHSIARRQAQSCATFASCVGTSAFSDVSYRSAEKRNSRNFWAVGLEDTCRSSCWSPGCWGFDGASLPCLRLSALVILRFELLDRRLRYLHLYYAHRSRDAWCLIFWTQITGSWRASVIQRPWKPQFDRLYLIWLSSEFEAPNLPRWFAHFQ